MKVLRLHLRSFRGFEELTLHFDPALTVLVGVNGAGKTAVLDALAILLSQLSSSIVTRPGAGRRFAESDIRRGASETVNEVEMDVHGRPATWLLATTRRGHPHTVSSTMTGMREVVTATQEQIRAGTLSSLPLAVYYPVNRAVLDIPQRIRKEHDFGPLSAYDGALAGGSRSFRVFFEWFRDQEDVENERRRRELFQEDPQLAAVRNAIHQMVPGFSNLRVQRRPKQRMLVTKRGVEFAVDQLSDGEKCLLALAGDLARRLALAHPGLKDPLGAEAVVLIDEIELHLHPAWQRNVLRALRRTFPGCQFILTTHSPQVLGEVPTASVRLLEDFHLVKPAAETEGRDSNAILSEVMGVPERPQEILERIHGIARLIDEDRLAEARAAIDELAHTLTERDAEVVRLRSLIDFLEGPR